MNQISYTYIKAHYKWIYLVLCYNKHKSHTQFIQLMIGYGFDAIIYALEFLEFI